MANKSTRTPNNSSSSNHKDSAQLLQTVNKLVLVQTKELELKEQELRNDSANITSNEKIALASIEAQKGDRHKQIEVYSKLHSQRHLIVGIAIIGVIIIISISMFTNNEKLAIELIKISGAVVLAYVSYLAGLHKGKLSNSDNRPADE